MGMLNAVKKGLNDKAKVSEWLDKIGETDQTIRDEVLAGCAADKEARAYFVKRYEEIEPMLDRKTIAAGGVE
jgi:hypothetical protein